MQHELIQLLDTHSEDQKLNGVAEGGQELAMLWGRLLHDIKCSYDGVQIMFRTSYGGFLYDYVFTERDILMKSSSSRFANGLWKDSLLFISNLFESFASTSRFVFLPYDSARLWASFAERHRHQLPFRLDAFFRLTRRISV